MPLNVRLVDVSDGVPEESFWTTVLSIAYSAIIHDIHSARLSHATDEP